MIYGFYRLLDVTESLEEFKRKDALNFKWLRKCKA